MKTLVIAMALIVAMAITGCSQLMEELTRDPRDAPWDPRSGQLFDQLPNWDNEATIRCGGNLYPGQGRSTRC